MSSVNRRAFLQTSTAAGAAVLASRLRGFPAVVSPVGRGGDRPNILVILTDQQQADALSCAGAAGLRTPAMDSLAGRGVRFARSYCYQPLCVPSRTSLLTGLPPRLFGTRVNNLAPALPAATPTLGRLMAGAGYDTAYVGKWHLPIAPADNALHGFAEMRAIADAGHNDNHVAVPCHRILRRSRSRPLFLVAGIINPHDICEYAAGYRAPNGDLPPPPSAGDCPALPANHAVAADEPAALLNARRFTREVYPTAGWNEARWRQYLWGYNRFVEKADRLVGRILDSLAASGREKDTLVIFASDHGDGGAAHLWNQKTALYEESVRVPLIVAGPGVAGRGRVDDRHLVSFGLDLLPTVCAYAGAVPARGGPGLSLRPIIEGADIAWRDHVVAETEFQDYLRSATPSGVRGRMIRTDRFKYTVYSAGANREQFFDLQADPGETRNLIDQSEHGGELLRHRTLLARWAGNHRDDFFAEKASLA